MRRYGYVAARSARGAAGDAGDRVSQERGCGLGNYRVRQLELDPDASDMLPEFTVARTFQLAEGQKTAISQPKTMVGGSGIEPLTPSMSRKFLGFEPICSALRRVAIINIIQCFYVCRPLSNFATICASLLAMRLLDQGPG